LSSITTINHHFQCQLISVLIQTSDHSALHNIHQYFHPSVQLDDKVLQGGTGYSSLPMPLRVQHSGALTFEPIPDNLRYILLVSCVLIQVHTPEMA
jgi:hypothetical protein